MSLYDLVGIENKEVIAAANNAGMKPATAIEYYVKTYSRTGNSSYARQQTLSLIDLYKLNRRRAR